MEENNFCMRKICQDLNSHAPTLHLVSFQRCGEKFLVWGTTLRTCTGTTLSKLSGGPLRNSLEIESEKSLKIVIISDFLFPLILLTLRFAKMRLERIEKLGVEMIEILPQVVQRNHCFPNRRCKGSEPFSNYWNLLFIRHSFLDINYAGLHGLLRALSCSK